MEIEDFGLPKSTLLKRMAVFKPCESMAELAQWIRVFFGIRFPEKIVSEESNSAPMPLLWELYDRMRRNDLEGFEQAMVYASRFSGKTLAAAVLEVLTILHMPRNVAHMAAIENQAKKAQAYVKDFTGRPIIRDFIYGDNAREVKIACYTHRKTRIPLTEREFNKLAPAQKEEFEPRREQYIKIVICNMAGANGDHVELMVIDELDVIPRQNIPAYHQAKGGIPVGARGQVAFTLFTSTRKSRVGLVQKEIEKAEKTGLQLRHWNVIDVTAPCPTSRYKPERPKKTFYVHDENVAHIEEEEFKAIPDTEKNKWYPLEGYDGCAKCKLFPACKGALATKQEGKVADFKSGGTALLVEVSEIASKFKSNTPEFITTEFLCFTEDAQVMMADGTVKSIATIKEGDFVITHLGNVQKVTGTMSRPYDGDLVVINPGTRNKHWGTIRATPEHPFYVGEDFKEAKKLVPWKFDKWGCLKSEGDYLSFPTAFVPTTTHVSLIDVAANPSTLKLEHGKLSSAISTKAKEIPNYFNLTYDFGWILGYFLAEGCIITNENGTHKSVTFSSDHRELEFHQRVRDFFETVYEHPTPSEHGYVQAVSSCIWSNVLNGLCGRHSDNKKIHPFVMGGPLDFQRGILEGFNAGDGTKDIVGGGELTTTSMQLASQLSLIAGRLGLCPRIQKLKKTAKKQAYRVYYSNLNHKNKQNRTKFALKAGYNQYRLGNKKSERFSGVVYNIEVAGDNSYIVNGVAVHNCRKPDASGLVYPRLKKEIHFKTSQQLAELVLGPDNAAHASTITGKRALWNLLKSRGARFYTGMDFGFGHLFAVATIAVWGQYALVIDAFGQSKLELDDKIEAVQYLKELNPTVFGDPEDPATVTTFKRRGFKMVDWSKSQGSVKAGIEIVRKKIFSIGAGATLFFLSEDAAIGELFREMEEYAFSTDAAGEFTEIPEKEDDDFPDALRYCVMNSFGKNGVLNSDKTSLDNNIKPPDPFAILRESQSKWMSQKINELTGHSSEETTDTSKIVRKGGFIWSGD